MGHVVLLPQKCTITRTRERMLFYLYDGHCTRAVKSLDGIILSVSGTAATELEFESFTPARSEIDKKE